LKGIQLDIGSHDSVTASFIYLHLSNALVQSGFLDKADKYIDKSIDLDQSNIYSQYVKAYIQFSRDQDFIKLKNELFLTLEKDSTRLDVIQEIGKIFYYLRDYEESYKYYKRFNEIKNYLNLESYPGEDGKIGMVYAEMGYVDESQAFLEAFWAHADEDQSIYRDLSKAAYFSYMGDTEKAVEHLTLFSEQENYHYWIILFIKIDPLLDNISGLPEFQELTEKIEAKFWESHARIQKRLEEKGLL